MKYRFSFLALALLLVLSTGCARPGNQAPADQAAAFGARLSQSYFTAYETYQDLERALSGPALDKLQALAPDLDRAKHLLVDYNEAVILWRAAGQAPDAFYEKREALRDLMLHLGQALARIATNHLSGE
jgi:hypothetical protein